MRPGYYARRILFAGLAFFASATLIFLLLRMMPGDYISNLLLSIGNTLPAETVAQFYETTGLGKPLEQQYVTFLSHVLLFDFGLSFRYGAPVSGIIFSRIGWTLLILLPATVLSLLFGTSAGIRSAWQRGSRTDISLMGIMLATRAIPSYWWGIMAIIVFGMMIPVFPIGGYTSLIVLEEGVSVPDLLWHAALPVIVLTVCGIPGTYYLVRSTMIQTLGEDYILAARARGLPERTVRYHAVRNALLPVVTMFSLELAGLLMGSVFIETIFAWPGIGLLMTEAIRSRDIPLLEGIFILDCAALILANLISDLIYPYLDPRVRQECE